MGEIAFGLRPRTRSRPSTIRTCEAGPERPGPEPLAWRPAGPGAADDEGPGAAGRTKPAITKLRSGVPDR